MSDTTLTPDEQRLKDYSKRLRAQYNSDPAFVGVQPHEKTDGGVYVFDVAVTPSTTRRCYYWRFIASVSGGQMAMNVGAPDGNTAAQVVDEWLSYRKQADKSRG